MEKRALIAFVLSMAVFVAWSYLFSPTRPEQTEAPTQTTGETDKEQARPQAETTTRTANGTPAEKATPIPQPEQARDVTVRTDLYTAVFTEWGGRLKSLTLNKYRTTNTPDSPAKELVYVASMADLPLAVYLNNRPQADLKQGIFKTDKVELDLRGDGRNGTIEMTCDTSNGLRVVRRYTFTPDSYLIGLKVSLINHTGAAIEDNLVLEMASDPITRKERYAGFAAWLDQKLLEIKPKDLEDEMAKLKKDTYRLNWAGYQDQYFLAAVLPGDQEHTRVTAAPMDNQGVRVGFVSTAFNIPAEGKRSIDYQVFYGPKDYKVLKTMNNELDRSIYLGWFDILSKPLLIFMTWLHQYIGNYGVVIIIVTILIKILFWPLTAKSYKSMKGMQKLQPKIMKLREKYKDDKEAMNREMMQLYKAFKVNPLGGCLPMVIQIPVFIALYRLLDYSLELRHAPFWLWINDLSTPDRLFDLGFKLPLMDPPTGIPVLTLLMGASMFITQKMTPTPGDPTQAKIMMFMPIFFTFIFINFPAGLVLYWLVNNILSIGQQYYINKSPS
ncbi:MAG: membrane protein insertase YidC [Proteobacteria bacterium]|nr:membrane protein insertase YidC [Pseudomonadota bacterium]